AREQVARDLKPIYTAVDADAAQAALEAFDDTWGSRFPVITQAWLNAWEHVTPFLAFPSEVRRVIYTTNAIEALDRQLRKAIKTKAGVRQFADAPRQKAARLRGKREGRWGRVVPRRRPGRARARRSGVARRS
ncbi:MAG TPA: transposase, partial [Burkholderiales bacterium]|nr:transposase [Burkholderiales bacterium]